jgi:hypothetical protein
MSKVISIRLGEGLIERIKAYCRDNNIPLEELGLANVLRGIIANYLKEKGYFTNLQSNQAMKQKKIKGGW